MFPAKIRPQCATRIAAIKTWLSYLKWDWLVDSGNCSLSFPLILNGFLGFESNLHDDTVTSAPQPLEMCLNCGLMR